MAEDFEVLVRQALTIDDLQADERWRIVRLLQTETDRAAFDATCRLARSDQRYERILGLDILAQFGVKPIDASEAAADRPARPFVSETISILLAALDDDDGDVLGSAIVAAGHLRDSRLLGPVLKHAEHPSEDIRHDVAFALPSLAGDPPVSEAVDELIRLSSDPDSHVRDWATFGLGSLLEDLDTGSVRDALAARLDDPDSDTAAEALVGLAHRHDPRALAPLLAWLDDTAGTPVIEAAAKLAAPQALPSLLRLRQRGWPSSDYEAELLNEAIEACTKAGTAPPP